MPPSRRMQSRTPAAIRAVAVLVAPLLALLAGCGSAPQAARPVQEERGVSVALRSRPTAVPTGESFSLTLVLHNVSGETRRFELRSAQTYEFEAFSDGEEIWRWSRGMMFAQSLTEVILRPGESRSFEGIWPTGAEAPGEYRVRGYFLGLPGARPVVTVRVLSATPPP